MDIALFDTRGYDRHAFDAANATYGHGLRFFEPRLDSRTATLAGGVPVVCPFVNDCLDAETIGVLYHGGTRLLALRSAGFNHVDLEAAATIGMRVVRVPEYSPYAVAELAMCLVLALNRQIHRAYNRVREANFSLEGLVGFDLHGKTFGIIGTGRIGRALARIAHGFGCRVVATDAWPDEALQRELGVEYVEAATLYRESDVISLHVPLTTDTHHMIDGDAFAQMKAGVMLINTSRGAPGADFSTFTDDWVNANIRARGPLGRHYPYPCCIHEGDTPAFLGLIDNGLGSAMSPTFGGWGGRYVWRQPHGEPRAFWTQGGDAYPGIGSSRDTVRGSDGQVYTSDQATIWRWREAFQHDFAARMAWTVAPHDAANHNPQVVVNGATGTAPILIDAHVGTPVALDARATRDPDGQALSFRWWYYAEAGTGIPGQPVLTAPPSRPPAVTNASPPAARGEREPARVAIESENSAQASVMPLLPGVAHLILEVTDEGTPRLTSYRRVILSIAR